ncbi:RNA chaperone Hfq [Paraburkholderia bryophila]|uniref:RNA-binding protein Hfq n=1 Tax=Paraburkholderia bryophila TaxID=420952 RepID=A0A7Y9WEQ7_9BURK|nr:RNA chaperone Hfq [Paraburkholderia bryophila]NYH19481.1 host factor-I protein [Paraburkholderia bryophila]
MASAESHPQNDFMNAARKERKRVEIYLVNGIRLTGCIESFDQYLVMLRTPVGLQGIYKRAISTIQLDTGTRPAPRTGRPSHGEHTTRGPHGSREPRDHREPREPREPRESYGAPSSDRPTPDRSSGSTSDGPVVVTRRRRLFGTGGGDGGNHGGGNHGGHSGNGGNGGNGNNGGSE